MLIPKPYKLLASLAVILMLVSGAYFKGIRDAGAKYNRQYIKAVQEHQEAEQERQEIARERDSLLEELDTLANKEPITTEQCLPTSRIRRLNQIR